VVMCVLCSVLKKTRMLHRSTCIRVSCVRPGGGNVRVHVCVVMCVPCGVLKGFYVWSCVHVCVIMCACVCGHMCPMWCAQGNTHAVQVNVHWGEVCVSWRVCVCACVSPWPTVVPVWSAFCIQFLFCNILPMFTPLVTMQRRCYCLALL